MQSFTAQESQSLVEFHGCRIGDLSLEDDLVRVTSDHRIDGHADKLRCDPSSSVLLPHGQHSDVATHWTRSMGFQLVDDDADEFVLVVEGLVPAIR